MIYILLSEIRRHQFPDIREKLKIGKSLSESYTNVYSLWNFWTSSGKGLSLTWYKQNKTEQNKHSIKSERERND